MLYIDRLVLDYTDTVTWLAERQGEIVDEAYASANDHSVSVFFAGGSEIASEFLEQPGVRRAIIAYWTKRLVLAAQNSNGSVFSRFHNYNAVAELKHRIQSTTIV